METDHPSMNPGRIVALDYGTRRVGVAIADPLRLFAQPHGTYSPDETVEVLLRLHAGEGIAVLVVGWPLLPDGGEGRATERVQEYINRLKKRLKGVAIEKMDERDTSREAVEALVEAGVPRKARRKKERIDSAAAVLILQRYLEE